MAHCSSGIVSGGTRSRSFSLATARTAGHWRLSRAAAGSAGHVAQLLSWHGMAPGRGWGVGSRVSQHVWASAVLIDMGGSVHGRVSLFPRGVVRRRALHPTPLPPTATPTQQGAPHAQVGLHGDHPVLLIQPLHAGAHLQHRGYCIGFLAGQGVLQRDLGSTRGAAEGSWQESGYC